MSIPPGATIGAYRVVELLGRGGMAAVYKAFQPRLSRYVAIKVLPTSFVDDPAFAERFEQEAVTVAQLDHPNILSVFEFGDEQGVPYLVTPFIDGGTLAQRVGRLMQPPDVAALLRPIASALDYAHARGVIHRDIKPSNILLRHDGTPVLADFGIAKMVDQPRGLTRTGMVVGTPEYIAPEQAMGEPASAAGDQYSLAVVVYELLTGRVPYSADTPMATLLAHINRELPPPRGINPDLTEEVEAVVLRGLAKNPEDRFPTILDMILALAAACGGDASTAVRHAAPTTTENTTAFFTDQPGVPASTDAVPQAPPTPVTEPTITPSPRAASLEDIVAQPTVLEPAAMPPLRDVRDPNIRTSRGEASDVETPSHAIAGAPAASPTVVEPLAPRAPTSQLDAHPATPLPSLSQSPEATARTSAAPTPEESADQSRAASLDFTATRSHPSQPAPSDAHRPPLPLFAGIAAVVVILVVAVGLLVHRGSSSAGSAAPTAVARSSGTVPTRVVSAEGRAPTVVAAAPSAVAIVNAPEPTATPAAVVTEAATTISTTVGVTRSELMSTRRVQASAVLLPSGKVLVTGGSNVRGDAGNTSELFEPVANEWIDGGKLKSSHTNGTTLLLKTGKVLAVGGATTGETELYDPASSAWTPAAELPNHDPVESATLLADGRVLVITPTNWSIYDASTNSWKLSGTASVRREPHTATLLKNGRVLLVGRSAVELYDPASNSFAPASAMATPRSSHTATLLLDGRVLVAGGTSNALVTTAELYDPEKSAWAPGGSQPTWRYEHTATLLPDGKVLLAGGYAGILSDTADVYDPSTGKFTTTGRMIEHRAQHTATLLPGGKVLLTGGRFEAQFLQTAEVYDGSTGAWTMAGASKGVAGVSGERYDHTATLLPDGRILVVGGTDGRNLLSSAFVYDPGTKAVTSVSRMATARMGHSATLLPSGKVVVIGGVGVRSTEIYDIAGNTWTTAEPMPLHRMMQTATLLPNGKILVVGDVAASELYDPSTNKWSPVPGGPSPRLFHTSTLLSGGKVLVSGGYFPTGEPESTYDSATNHWLPVANPLGMHAGHVAALLTTGGVLVAGGSGGKTQPQAEIYEPATNKWSTTGPMGSNRYDAAASSLPDGRVLVVGGQTVVYGSGSLATVEEYDATSNTWTAMIPIPGGRYGHTATTLKDGRVVVIGGDGGETLPIATFDPGTKTWTSTTAR